MVDQQPTQQQGGTVTVTQARGWSTGKTVATLILIPILILLGVYGYFWITSASGAQTLDTAIGYLKYPVTWYTQQIKGAQEIGSIWQAEKNISAEEIGIKFQDFTSVGTTILPAGATLAFKYKLDVGKGVSDLRINPRCDIEAKDKGGMKVQDVEKSKPVIIPEKPKISTDDPLSYSNILCQIETNNDLTEDRKVTAEGTISFTQPKQRNSLRVYFTKDTTNIGDKFFETYGIEEKLPIKSSYNNEPAELGIGVSDENIQPVVLAENYIPSLGISLANRWDGRVTKVKEMNLYLPKEVTIDKSRSPASTLCPFEEPISSGANYIKYEAKKGYLEKLPEFGRGIKETLLTYQRFFCWLKVDSSILGGAEYIQDQYSVDVVYDYEFQSKKETITLKGVTKGGETAESTEEKPEEEITETKHYLCQDKTTEKYSCITKCTENCGTDCELYEFPNKEDCEEHIKGLE